MTQTPTPRQILATLFPHLRVAAAYAHQIQSRIAAQPEKERSQNHFAAALSDADLSVQTFVEVALLGTFPKVRFYGEEYEKTYNTKYFRAIDLGAQGDYLIALDPIDGTRFYLDGHTNYQILLSVLNADDYEAVLAITPARREFTYALRGEGAFRGSLDNGFDVCEPLHVVEPNSTIFLGMGMEAIAPNLSERYQVIAVKQDYSADAEIPNVNGILTGELAGVAIARGSFLDGAALAFIAREAGAIVTTLDGSSLPPLHACDGYYLPGLVMATSPQIHQDLVNAASNM